MRGEPLSNLCTRQRFAPSPCLKHESIVGGSCAKNLREFGDARELRPSRGKRQMREARRKMKSWERENFFLLKLNNAGLYQFHAFFIRYLPAMFVLGWPVSLRMMCRIQVHWDCFSACIHMRNEIQKDALQPLRWIYPPPVTVFIIYSGL